jgi:hypothetical protein
MKSINNKKKQQKSNNRNDEMSLLSKKVKNKQTKNVLSRIQDFENYDEMDDFLKDVE